MEKRTRAEDSALKILRGFTFFSRNQIQGLALARQASTSLSYIPGPVLKILTLRGQAKESEK